MQKRKLCHRLITAVMLCIFMLQMGVYAANTTDSKINDTTQTIDSLEKEKQEQQDKVDKLKNYKSNLSQDLAKWNTALEEISQSLIEIQAQIDEKTDAIAAAETEIASLNQSAVQLKEAMSKRIQYTYEKGETSFWTALVTSDSFSDLLNRAEYLKAMQEYDRAQLIVYQDTVQQIAAQKTELENLKQGLLASQQENETKKQEADNLIAQKKQEAEQTGTELTEAQNDLNETDAELQRQKDYEEELERQKAEEDAKRLEEIKNQEDNIPPDVVITPTEGDLAVLAAIIQCEAGGESYEGKLAVGSVVLNRVASPSFPDSIVAVVYQKGQFSPVASGRFAAVLAKGADAECVQAASDVLAGTRTLNCLYFRRNNGLINGIIIGNHVFY